MIDKTWAIFSLAVVGLCILGLAIVAEGYIPPTRAFSTVYINGEPIQSTAYNDKLYITTKGMITTTVTGKNITMKLSQINYPLLQGIKGVDVNGNLFCGVT